MDDLIKKTTFIESCIDQMVTEGREAMFAIESQTGRGAELHKAICETVSEFRNNNNGIDRLIGLLLDIGHSTVIASMARSVEKE